MFSESYGENRDVSDITIAPSSSRLQNTVRSYRPEDTFNANKFGLHFQIAPNRTIAQQPIPGRKEQKSQGQCLRSFAGCSKRQ